MCGNRLLCGKTESMRAFGYLHLLLSNGAMGKNPLRVSHPQSGYSHTIRVYLFIKCLCLGIYLKQTAFESNQNQRFFANAFCHVVQAEIFSYKNVKTPKQHCKIPSRTTFSILGRLNANTNCFSTYTYLLIHIAHVSTYSYSSTCLVIHIAYVSLFIF